ncbi:MAG: glycosyltransferase [Candidatus Omnitrophica bacterium]|nr:glycosyltransferase [Candidatus Omnitrophota bacterium]
MTYVTAGTGHRRAAEAVAQALQARWPGAAVECLDALHDTPAWFDRGYGWAYLFLVRHCAWLWRITYACSDWGPLYQIIQPLRHAWNLCVTRRFARRLREAPPDLIITAHFLPADVCGAWRRAGWLRVPLVVVVTDLYAHRFWLSQGADLTVVATEETRRLCEARGVPRERLRVIGIPIAAAFHAPLDREAVAQREGLTPGRMTVLIGSGGTTVGHFERVVEGLLALEAALPGRLQLLVVCGQDEAARQRLAARALMSAMPMRVFGFVETMAELMGVADLMVSKAGGLMVMEALARGVPLVLYHVIPGQERLNARAVQEAGAGCIAHGAGDAARWVRRLLEEPDRLVAMRQACRRLACPDAAPRIVREAVEPLLAGRA